jgi:hypothetical protein
MPFTLSHFVDVYCIIYMLHVYSSTTQCVQCQHACSTSFAQAAVCLIIRASLGSVGLERASDRSCDSLDGTPGRKSVSPDTAVANSNT